MRRGFTILELLVAALLLGMLVTVLTMVFNQSSIAWRTGVAGLIDMDDVRENIANIRDEADSIYIWNKQRCRTVSVWNEESYSREEPFKNRAIICENGEGANKHVLDWEKKFSLNVPTREDAKIEDLVNAVNVERTTSQTRKSWLVNVMSCGPNRNFDDYDDIWSVPDDFD